MSRQGRVALVTGGAGGLGYAIAGALGRAGYELFILDVDEESGRTSERRLLHGGVGGATYVPCDISSADSVAAAFAQVDRRADRIDVLVNAAGIREISRATELSPGEWDRVIAVNLSGPFYSSQQAAARMGQGSSIVNVASVAAMVGMANRPAYTASKHGLVGLTKNLARDFGELGIRVNAVAPGTVRTPMTEAYYHDEQFLRDVEGVVPLGFECSPSQVADAAVFLCSDMASYINGVVLPVDGGWLAEKNYAPRSSSAAYGGAASPLTTNTETLTVKANNHG